MEIHAIPAAQLPRTPSLFRRNLRAPSSPKFLSLSLLQTPSPTTRLKYEIESNKLEFPTKRMFILGMGYVGQFFAQHLYNEGWEVAGTCMSDAKKKLLEQKGYDIHVFDAMEPEWNFLDRLRCCTHLLVSIPPILGIGDPILQHEDAFKASLVDGSLQWLCYLSTTSIYGDASGAWVDENYTPKPSSNLSKMRLKSEEGWLKLGQELGLSTYVFRLGGIYGPGRSAIDTILKKEEMSERQKKRGTRKFTSRIHVADICQALKASISIHAERKIYNVVDDDPASRAEVFELARQLIEQRWPGLIGITDNSINSTLLGGAEKRVSNAHIKKELGVKLLYPSYRLGLPSIIDNMEDPLSHSG